MAPQGTQEFIGVTDVDVPKVSARTVAAKVAVVLTIVGVLTLGLYSVTSVSDKHIKGTLNVQNSDIFEGDDLPIFADCECMGDCLADTDGDGIHFCNVGTRDCMGIDYHKTYYDEAVTTDEMCLTDGVANGECTAACEYVEGRYDCWNFPCLNGGFCTDGNDEYQCHCTQGYDGINCERDINECKLTAPDEVVCHEQAACENSDGKYSCECNVGWEGDGYMVEDPAGGPAYWMDSMRAVDSNIEGCRDIDDCNPMPCKNGATCINAIGEPRDPEGFVCVCTTTHLGKYGWVGRYCEADVEECLLEEENDCDAKSTCEEQPGTFGCNCHEHWQRFDHVSEEHDGPFDHSGHVDTVDTSSLREYGSGGGSKGCYDVLDCASDPCQHGGTCTEGPDGCEEMQLDGTFVMVACYECTCAYGWTGTNCERDEDECISSMTGQYLTGEHNCNDYALCTNTPGSYECSCNAGWTGDGVATAGCIDADDCEFSPCAHGGTCYDCGTLCFTCDCVAGWRGTTCGTDWNECMMGIHQCHNEATCLNNPGSYDCRCDPGFTGTGMGFSVEEYTDTWTVGGQEYTRDVIKGCKDIDDCVFTNDYELWTDVVADGRTSGPCVRGSCEDKGPNAYHCSCEPGYRDNNCDQDKNECDPVLGDNNCHKFADCTDTEGSYECECMSGFEGNGITSCTDISDCDSQCTNGFCTDLGVNDFRCNCDSGYMDRLCDSDINECTSYTHNCARNSLCTNSDGSFNCECNAGFAGDALAKGSGCSDIDDCERNPCVEGTCSDEGANSYLCECFEGFTDFNCDYDVNECYLKTHDCHEDARCVNIPGTYMCRCLSGWAGDGFTCVDIDDCDPDPCDADHGTCEDTGPNRNVCHCDPGWGCNDLTCEGECDECEDGTHSCDPNAACANTLGSFECACNYPESEDPNAYGYFGDGATCASCTICGPGWAPVGNCELEDRSCENIDECLMEIDNCNDHASCIDSVGSFLCECDQNGVSDGRYAFLNMGDEWWGTGVDEDCTRCTVCYDGYHEVEPCTSTTDRICTSSVPDGIYLMESEADDNRMCVAIMADEWYPARINYGNGEEWCGLAIPEGEEPSRTIRAEGSGLVWRFKQLGSNEHVEPVLSDLYTIESQAGGDGDWRCLFFGDEGKDLYPSLQTCAGFDANKDCPWYKNGEEYCGFPGGIDALVHNGQATWKVSVIKLNEKKFILQNAANGNTDSQDNALWECLAFEKNGAATNPSRYNWGNGDLFCGAGDWEGLGREIALLSNKQAVFILTSL